MATEKTIKNLETAANLLKPLGLPTTTPEDFRLDVTVTPDNLQKVVETLVTNRWGYLSAITGRDYPAPAPAEGAAPEESHLEVLYHFCEGAAVTTLRVELPYSNAIIPTICNILPTATLYERELIEMFGVVIEDTPVTDHLLLTDDWPKGVYPLRKSFTGLNREKS